MQISVVIQNTETSGL